MKNRASKFLKQVWAIVGTVVKAKTSAVKSKAAAVRTRMIVCSVLKNKKFLFSTISHKIHALLGHEKADGCAENKAIMAYYPATVADETTVEDYCNELVEEDDYPDLTHSIFENEEMEFENHSMSIIDIVKKSLDSDEFVLENEIDRVADLFIKRFRRQTQKQESFKMYEDMLNRSM